MACIFQQFESRRQAAVGKQSKDQSQKEKELVGGISPVKRKSDVKPLRGRELFSYGPLTHNWQRGEKGEESALRENTRYLPIEIDGHLRPML